MTTQPTGASTAVPGLVQVTGLTKSYRSTPALRDYSLCLDSGHIVGLMVRIYSTFFADFDADKAASMVDFFGLPTDRRLGEMSKGMGEKLQISLVMSRRARVFLLDEPISGVDPATRDVILDGILREFDPASLLIMSTHLISDIEHFVDYALFMKDGQVLLQGDADDLRASHGDSLDAIFRKEYR